MICKNCNHKDVCKHKTESVYECEHFKDGTIKNQYDRIRNMSVEELAELCIEYRDDWDDYATHVGCFYKYEEALKKEIEWLESEVDTE